MELPSLSRPERFSDKQWDCIDEQFSRLQSAIEAEDHSLAIESAKNLAESTARAICDREGLGLGGRADFTKAINEAHKALKCQPGEDKSSEGASRKLAQGYKSIVVATNELRNGFGVSHAGPQQHKATEREAQGAVVAARLWASWILAKVDLRDLGDLDDIIDRLGEGVWRRGDLAERLLCVDWENEPKLDHERLGIAVGRRWGRDTFVVREDGVDPAASNASGWPERYRLGLVKGLLVDEEGLFNLKQGGHRAGNVEQLYSDLSQDFQAEVWTYLIETRIRREDKDWLDNLIPAPGSAVP